MYIHRHIRDLSFNRLTMVPAGALDRQSYLTFLSAIYTSYECISNCFRTLDHNLLQTIPDNLFQFNMQMTNLYVH